MRPEDRRIVALDVSSAAEAQNLSLAIAADPDFGPPYRLLAQLKAQQQDRAAAEALLAQGLARAGAMPPDILRGEIQKVRSLTSKPFGVNLYYLSPFFSGVLEVILEERVPVVTTGAGTYFGAISQKLAMLTNFSLSPASIRARAATLRLLLPAMNHRKLCVSSSSLIACTHQNLPEGRRNRPQW
jgi:NAD(P)H-dependent flavin oxidoreductase YrpB (nitropropane dioxygenase family)